MTCILPSQWRGWGWPVQLSLLCPSEGTTLTCWRNLGVCLKNSVLICYERREKRVELSWLPGSLSQTIQAQKTQPHMYFPRLFFKIPFWEDWLTTAGVTEDWETHHNLPHSLRPCTLLSAVCSRCVCRQSIEQNKPQVCPSPWHMWGTTATPRPHHGDPPTRPHAMRSVAAAAERVAALELPLVSGRSIFNKYTSSAGIAAVCPGSSALLVGYWGVTRGSSRRSCRSSGIPVTYMSSRCLCWEMFIRQKNWQDNSSPAVPMLVLSSGSKKKTQKNTGCLFCIWN